MFQVCFLSNCSEIKFRTVTSGMQIGGGTVQNHDSDSEQLLPSKRLFNV